MNRMLSPFEKNGSMLSYGSGRMFYHRIDNPFVFSVEAIPRTDDTFMCEWWVSGPTSPEFGYSPPVLLMHLAMGLKCEKEDLEKQLEMYWETRIQELSFASAMAGGITVDPRRLKELSEQTQRDVIQQHLYSHEMLQHFPGPNKPARATLTIRAAFMYALLRSMGVSKVQKEIADFESLNFAGNWEEIKDGQDISVSPETINQRLTHAKKLGLLQNLTPKKAQAQRPPSSSAGIQRGRNEFASRGIQKEQKGDAKHDKKE